MMTHTIHVSQADALRALEGHVHLTVKAIDCVTPPLRPADGDRYIVPAEAVGVWTGHGSKIAHWQDETWQLYTPLRGWLAEFGNSPEHAVLFDGATWHPAPTRPSHPFAPGNDIIRRQVMQLQAAAGALQQPVHML